MLDDAADTRFDELVADDRLFFEPTEPEAVTDKGFKFQFRLTTVFDRKPVPENSNESEEAKPNPFLEPEKGFVLEDINSTHLLQFNKFCIYRPQFILHTKTFQAQTDDLNRADFEAAIKLLSCFRQPYVVFYNCGTEAGSSQGHKHLQSFPKPDKHDFQLFMDAPEMQQLRNDSADPIQPPESLHVPFQCFGVRILADNSGSEVYSKYLKCLEMASRVSDEIKGHNMIMTSDWLCVIPRRHRGRFRVPANAMGMMGMCWLGTWTERMGWTLQGPASHLAYLGVPIDKSS